MIRITKCKKHDKRKARCLEESCSTLSWNDRSDDNLTCYFCYDVFDSKAKFKEHKKFHKSDKNTQKGEVQCSEKMNCHNINNDCHVSNEPSLQNINYSTTDITLTGILASSEVAPRNPAKTLINPEKALAPPKKSIPKTQHQIPKFQVKNIRKKKNQKFYCYDCGRSFTTKRWLKSHLNNMHNAYHTNEKSPPPSINFSTADITTTHNEEEEEEEENLQNNVHGNSNTELPDTIQKLQRKKVPWTKQDDEGRYLCEKCPKSYSKLSGYRSHYVRHHFDSVIACKLCTYVSNSENDIMEHKQQRHRYQCEQCETIFSTKHGLIGHIQRDHLKQYIPCKYCGKEFAEAALNIHFRRVHSIEEQKCNICNKIFKNKNRLSEHIERTHSTKTVICPVCGKSIKAQSFIPHRRSHKGKQYECKICNRGYASRNGAKTCEKRHKNIKNFKCDLCSKSFFYYASLMQHHRLHTGEKPYACNQCDRRFYGQQTLYKHSLSHL